MTEEKIDQNEIKEVQQKGLHTIINKMQGDLYIVNEKLEKIFHIFKDLNSIKAKFSEFENKVEEKFNKFKEDIHKDNKDHRDTIKGIFNGLSIRISELESYLKEDKFHDLLEEINKLEEEFEKEVKKLVMGKSNKAKP